MNFQSPLSLCWLLHFIMHPPLPLCWLLHACTTGRTIGQVHSNVFVKVVWRETQRDSGRDLVDFYFSLHPYIMKSRGFLFYCFWFLSLLLIFALTNGWTNPDPFPFASSMFMGKMFPFDLFRGQRGEKSNRISELGSLGIRVTFFWELGNQGHFLRSHTFRRCCSKGQRCKVSIFHGDLPSCRKQRQREVSFPPGAAPSLPLFSRFSSQTNALGRSNKFSFMRSLLTLRQCAC